MADQIVPMTLAELAACEEWAAKFDDPNGPLVLSVAQVQKMCAAIREHQRHALTVDGEKSGNFAGERLGETRRAEVTAIADALIDIHLDLANLGHAYARLDANARYYIGRHLVGLGWRHGGDGDRAD